MTTIPYLPGSPGPFVVRLIDDFGIPVPAVAAQLRIETRAACVAVNAMGPCPDFAFELDGHDLPPRLYAASLHYDADDGAGWRFGFKFLLNIKRGC